MNRVDVTFPSQGETCSGWLYLPDSPKAKSPAIAMAHGLAATREMYDLPAFAEHFVQAGLAVLLFDYRYSGASSGLPRGTIDPQKQIDDYKNALCYLSQRDEVDADRLGVWGTSLSGGHVLHVGAYDNRVKCVVSQVPAINLYATFKASRDSEAFAAIYDTVNEQRMRAYNGDPDRTIAVNAPAGQPCLIPGQAAFDRSERERALLSNVNRDMTIASLERLLEYAPGSRIELIAPCPLLIIIAEEDEVTPADLAEACFSRAGDPSSIIRLPCKHYDVYRRENEEYFALAVRAATEWFTTHLMDDNSKPELKTSVGAIEAH